MLTQRESYCSEASEYWTTMAAQPAFRRPHAPIRLKIWG